MSNPEPEMKEGGLTPMVPIKQAVALDHECEAISWDDLTLSSEMRKAIDLQAWSRPSNVQAFALPKILKESSPNVIVQAKNGSGKTAAFILAMLSKADSNIKKPQCLCLGPSHELARQNCQVAADLGKFMDIKVALIIPNESWDSTAQIIFASPGKVKGMLQKKEPEIDASEMILLVLDEADHMVNDSMGRQTVDIKNAIQKQRGEGKIQTLCFSATFSTKVHKFVQRMAGEGAEIVGKAFYNKKENVTIDCISQHYVICKSQSAKFETCCELYSCMTVGQSVIFVKSRENAKQLAIDMEKKGYPCSILTGGNTRDANYDPDVRKRVMEDFRAARSKVLITTDVLARGIDVPAVTLVVNFDPVYGIYPDGESQANAEETYLHRIGRTGRFGEPGMAINLVAGREKLIVDHIAKYYDVEISELELDPEKIEQHLKDMRNRAEPAAQEI